MPDVSMCKNETCSWAHECYRFLAVPDKHQSYARFIQDDCDHFIKVKPGDKLAKGREK